MLRSSIACGLSIAAGISAACAADLPRRSAPIAPAPYFAPVPVFNWTGFYAGVNAGAGFRSAPATSVTATGFTAPAPGTAYQGATSGSSAGFTGGAQIGYNWQFQNNLVAGLEGDIEYIGRRGTRGAVLPANPGTPYFAYNPGKSGSNWIGTVRPRLGYAVDRTLLYVTGGLAFGSVSNGGSVTYNDGVVAAPYYVYGANSSNSTKLGWAAGVGGEYAITPNLIARAEYLYASLGSKGTTYAAPTGAPAGTSFSASSRTFVSLVRAGISYKF